MTIKFIIPGDPQGKARPRFANGHAYTPEKTREYEQLIALMYWTSAAKYTFPADTPLSAKIVVHKRIAKSATKAKREQMLNGTERPMTKPDADNIAKCILDALNGVAYPDDRQIVDLSVTKYYSDNPCVIVEISDDWKEQNMTEAKFSKLCKKLVVDYTNSHLDETDNKQITEDDVYIVWMCKTLQNNKALASTTLFDGMYYEITLNGYKNEVYFDAYKKWYNEAIPITQE